MRYHPAPPPFTAVRCRLPLPLAGVIAALALARVATDVHAQGSRADYDRALGLEKATENRVFRDRVKAHWFGDGEHFWYRVRTGPEAYEFILVTAATGERKQAFDHQRLAAALSLALHTEMRPDRLELEDVEFRSGEPAVVFRVVGKGWRWNLETQELREQPRETTTLPPQSMEQAPRASLRTGEETELIFVNRTRDEIELFWLDAEGERRSYGRIGAGDERRQHTFDGHVWLIVDRAGRALGVFEATDEPGRVVIDESTGITVAARETGRGSDRPPGASPDGRWTAFVRDHNLVLRDAKSGEESLLTSDGTVDDDYVGPVHWSPDSTRLVVLQTRPAQEHKVRFVESSPKDQLQPRLRTIEYLKPGDQIAHPRPRLFDVTTRKLISIDEALFPNPYELEDIRWATDSSRFTFRYNQRGHQVLRIVEVAGRDGAARALIEERSPTFVDYADKTFLHWIDATGEAIWMSERDGWNHLYLYDTRRGEVKNPITRGEWVVRRVEHVDEERRQVWFFAGGVWPGQDPYYLHLCRANFDGTGFTVLSGGDGTHEVEFSPDRRFILDRWSRVDQPPVTELRRAADGRQVCELERGDATALLAAGWSMPDRFVAKGRDGRTDIYGILVKPAHLDPKRKYPVVEEIYAGPQDAHVPKAFGRLTRQHAIAELGFIVVQIDGMGTNWRGKKFHDVCWKDLADAGFPDRKLWIKAAAASRPWMDLSRVGIYGGSAGGQNAMRALLDHGDLYRVAVADCGCHDNRMDKLWWNELWLGWPVDESYARNSNVVDAQKLQGKLLLIVGELDNNVDPASTMQVVNALEKANKDFELLVMTGTGHGAAETPYGSRRRMDFLVHNLMGVEP